MKKTFLLLVLTASLFSCKSDDDSATETDNITSAELTILYASNEPLPSGALVYAYNENTWEVIGDDTQFADFTVSTNDEGIAVFSNLTSDLTFNELNNFQQTIRFSVHYFVNDVETTSVKAITFNLGDDKADTIVLDI